ncbi:MAG TPA: AraC family ligand binding domain-containing protein, partial [Devosia sp.]
MHYPNMAAIPVYGLYGEGDSSFGQDWLHWETIQSRSRLHGYRIAPHRHEQFFQVLLLTAGETTASLDGAVAELPAPAAVVVPALTVHGYTFSPDVDGVVLTLMEREVAAAGLTFSNAAIARNARPVQAAMDAVVAEAQRPGAWHEQALRSHVALLLIALHRAVDEAGFAGTQ